MALQDIVFNDASLIHLPVPNPTVAQQVFDEFIATLGALVDENICRSVLRSHVCFQDVIIPTTTGEQWKVEDWLIDPGVDRELRLFALGLDTKVPIEKGLVLESEIEEALIELEYRAGKASGPICYAGGLAIHAGGVLVSIPTDGIWDVHQLTMLACRGTTVLQAEDVDHASREVHVCHLREAINARHFTSVATAAEFSASKSIIFPNLRFSPDVDDQVRRIESVYLINALKKLAKMNETAVRWAELKCVEPEYSFQWHRESEPTMDAYGKEREFRMPDGGSAAFENHVYFSGRHRIHFIEDRASRDFIIGYIGDHLPTVKYPH
ncbi:hypothetical protein [Zoogloea sp.]|uniref:hypothetical protein n=1 Tax=Zoogloea sp. TaxID=49181 RepID=UPI0025EE51A7|nr:hypothetical protein [Zoogloea sp.]MCK6396547.1 hypothetical protein [Zoogloea sp.]